MARLGADSTRPDLKGHRGGAIPQTYLHPREGIEHRLGMPMKPFTAVRPFGVLGGQPVVHVRKDVVDLVTEHLEDDDDHYRDEDEDERVLHHRLSGFVAHCRAMATRAQTVNDPPDLLEIRFRDGHAIKFLSRP